MEKPDKKDKITYYYEDFTLDTYFAQNKVTVPEVEKSGFSFRILWAFTGPGFLMSIAYLDPGNIESDLQSGSIGHYRLLWVLLLATILGYVMQSMSAKLGVVTGLHLAEMCYRQYKKVPRIILWIMVEIAVIGSDMQEVIGTAIAIYLLSNQVVPLWAGCLITIVDTFTFLFLDKYGLRKLEMLFAFLITVMGITFGYEYIVSKPPQIEVIKGLFIPWCQDCDSKVLLQAVGVVGAVIMPHNLYLHSALVKSRLIDRTQPKKLKEARMYILVENAIALVCSFIINVFVVSVFAYGLFEKTNHELLDECKNNNFVYEKAIQEFEDNDEFVDADIYKGGIFLGCAYGATAMYIWAIGILSAGQSSTMTGTYSGQFAMEGFLNLQWSRWKRVLFTRSIAMVPTFFTAFFSSLNELTAMNDYLNAVMSLQLPFAILPVVAFTSNPKIMGDFVNGWPMKITAFFVSVAIIIINIYFVIGTLQGLVLSTAITATIACAAVLYAVFVAYLALHLYISLGYSDLKNNSFMQKYVIINDMKKPKPKKVIDSI